ncbi:hypothetical protein EVAR_85741_1 [Eumeta japonica]|uniref:Uncharacterized protein n=1 Tax=Eumeta variegata TaxID=151549 RepID=A0A4C1ZFP5_EUMVA|nr:hypothetical protein EVAR_85741_1 [Eumeta japonica]
MPDSTVARDQPEMDIDPSSAPTSRATMQPCCGPQTQTTSTASVESTRNPVSPSTHGDRQTAPRTGCQTTAPRPKLPPPILRKGANFSKYPQTAPVCG